MSDVQDRGVRRISAVRPASREVIGASFQGAGPSSTVGSRPGFDLPPTRAALALTTCRVVAGSLLCAHSVYDAIQVPRLVVDGLWQPSPPRLTTAFAVLSVAAWRLGPSGLRVWFIVGALLGASIAFGYAPRICAAVLVVVSAATYHLLEPALTVNDYLAETVPFWLALLPDRGARTAHGREARRGWMEEGLSAAVLIEGLAFYVFSCLQLINPSPLARAAVVVSVALALLPIGPWRTLIVLPAAAEIRGLRHLDSTATVRGTVAALCALVIAWGVAIAAAPRRPNDGTVGVPAALGGCVVVLLALHGFARDLGIASVAQSTSGVLANVGLPWSSLEPLENTASDVLDIGFISDHDAQVRVERLDPGNERVQLMLRLLVRRRTAQAEDDGSAFIAALAARHCRSGGTASRAHRPEQMLIVRADRVMHKVLDFQCGEGAEAVKVFPIVPLPGGRT